jgi:hypothetical protein
MKYSCQNIVLYKMKCLYNRLSELEFQSKNAIESNVTPEVSDM